METLATKTKEELLSMVLEQRIEIEKLNTDLSLERAQIDELITDIKPIVDEIQSSNKFLRFVKIIKLSIALVSRIVKYIKTKE